MARVRLFAALREIAGASELDADGSTVGELCDELSARFGPEFGRIVAAGSVVVDGRAVPREHHLPEDAEVALLPPVSGGDRNVRAWPRVGRC